MDVTKCIILAGANNIRSGSIVTSNKSIGHIPRTAAYRIHKHESVLIRSVHEIRLHIIYNSISHGSFRPDNRCAYVASLVVFKLAKFLIFVALVKSGIFYNISNMSLNLETQKQF